MRGSTQHSNTEHGFVLTTSGGSTSMFKHITRAAAAVLRRPGAEPRHGWGFWDHGGPGVGFPQVKWRFADQYGMGGVDSMLLIDSGGGLRGRRPRSTRSFGEGEREGYGCSVSVVSESSSVLVVRRDWDLLLYESVSIPIY